jgi:hypothetical protein
MRFTSPSRRALGLLAVSTIGMSTAVLGVVGVASAAPIDNDSSISASSSDGDAGLTIPDGYCYAYVQIDGASGGGQDSSSAAGSRGEQVSFYMTLEGGDELGFATGTAGQADTDGTTNGAGGTSAADSSLNGTAGAPGGGGGAGAGLLLDGSLIAVAAGGDGAGADGGAGGGTSGVEPEVELLTGRDVQVRESVFPNSSVSVQAIGCNAPDDPSIGSIDAADGEATVIFSKASPGGEYMADPASHQYSIDGGTSWTTLTQPQLDAGFFTIPGLTNGTTYSVTMRTTSVANGPSQVSAPMTVTPYVATGAPTITAVRTAPSQITVSWAPSAQQGTFPVAGYGVYWGQGVPTDQSEGQGGGGPGGTGCEVGASVTSCTFFVPAGADYQVGVYAQDTAGHFSGPGTDRTGITVPGSAVPTAVPTQDNGDITGPAGPISSLTAGQKVTLTGSGYAPNSTVTLVVYSSPVTLGTVVADANGNFSVEVTVPANLANGTHYLVATGVDAQGNTRNLVITVTVSGGVATLATTGFDAVPVAVGGALVLLVGGGLLVGARRRSTNA